MRRWKAEETNTCTLQLLPSQTFFSGPACTASQKLPTMDSADFATHISLDIVATLDTVHRPLLEKSLRLAWFPSCPSGSGLPPACFCSSLPLDASVLEALTPVPTLPNPFPIPWGCHWLGELQPSPLCPSGGCLLPLPSLSSEPWARVPTPAPQSPLLTCSFHSSQLGMSEIQLWFPGSDSGCQKSLLADCFGLRGKMAD